MGMQDAVAAAVGAAATYVADGGPAAWERPPRPADALTGTGLAEVAERVARLRSLGRTVVSTSGCFDLLHVGHLQMLHRARALGDHLVVLLNSDASVRRLKGPPRPFQNEHDRAQLLRGVGCVDDVVVFDEATPIDALRVLRPHLFVKGGDYSIEDLPEAAVAHDWGGSVVVVPYLPGYSTTSLAARAAAAEPRFR
jgi:rfaE bifunctional protein nucleotidyltransferase chain/domain